MFAKLFRQSVGSPSEESICWSGWDAALIKGKQRKAKQKVPPCDYDQKPPEEDIGLNSKKAKFDGASTADRCMDIDGGELRVPKTKQQYKTDKAHCEPEALRYGLWHVAAREERCQPLLMTIVKVVAFANGWGTNFINWDAVEKLLPPPVYDKLKADVSSSIAKFVLSIFDMEEFATGSRTKTRELAVQKLFRELQTDFVRADTWEFLDHTKFVENQKISMKVIAEAEDKGVKYSFDGLYEQDFVFMMMHHVRPTVVAEQVPAARSYFLMPYDESDPEQVLKAMKSFVPLKVDRKMTLTLELSRGKCYRILDYLFVEVCKGFLSEELFEALDTSLQGKRVTTLSVLSKFVSEVQLGLRELADLKSRMIRYSQSAATYPLRKGPFGVFAEEVIEAIEMADHERRAEGHRFIGVHDILFGLYHSRVSDHELVRSGFSNSSPLEPPEMPPYRIYKLAGEYANRYGSDEVKLEHLVYAVAAAATGTKGEACNIPMEAREEMNTLPPVESWEDAPLEHCSKPITDCESLVQAIKEGFSLPSNIRLEL